MKVRKTPLLFFICTSLTMLSCDNGESDRSISNLSEFAKEFVSTHIGSSGSINMENETPFSQLIQNLLSVLILMMVVRFIDRTMGEGLRKKLTSRYVLPQPHSNRI